MQPTLEPCYCSVDSVSLESLVTAFFLCRVRKEAKRLCGVLLLWERLSAELWSGCSTLFTVAILATNDPLGAVQVGRETER